MEAVGDIRSELSTAVRRETKDPEERRWRIFCSKESVAGRDVLVGEHSIRHRYHIDWLLWLLHSIDNHWYWCTTIVVPTLGNLYALLLYDLTDLVPQSQRNGEVLWSLVPQTLKVLLRNSILSVMTDTTKSAWYATSVNVASYIYRHHSLSIFLSKYVISININLTDIQFTVFRFWFDLFNMITMMNSASLFC